MITQPSISETLASLPSFLFVLRISPVSRTCASKPQFMLLKPKSLGCFMENDRPLSLKFGARAHNHHPN